MRSITSKSDPQSQQSRSLCIIYKIGLPNTRLRGRTIKIFGCISRCWVSILNPSFPGTVLEWTIPAPVISVARGRRGRRDWPSTTRERSRQRVISVKGGHYNSRYQHTSSSGHSKKWKIFGRYNSRNFQVARQWYSSMMISDFSRTVRTVWWGWTWWVIMMRMLVLSLMLVLMVAKVQPSVYSGREDICNLSECDCQTDTVICTCNQDSSFQV